MARTNTFVVQKCTISYPRLFTPKAYKPGTPPKYSALIIVDAKAAKRIMSKAKELIAEAFPGKTMGADFKMPVIACKDHSACSEEPRFEGMYVMSTYATEEYPPKVSGMDREPILSAGDVYAGCQVAVGISMYTYDKGVGVGLNAVMKTGEGSPLGGGMTDTAELFKDVEVDEDMPDTPF